MRNDMKLSDWVFVGGLGSVLFSTLGLCAWSVWLSANPLPPQAQPPYQSIQTIRIEYVQVQQPEAK